MSAVLTDVDTVEVSLVDRGANMKRFALRKQERRMSSKTKMTKAQKETLTKLLKGITVGEVPAKLKKALADLSEPARQAVMSAIGILATARGDLPDGLLQGVMEACGIESTDDMLDLVAPSDDDGGDTAADPSGGNDPLAQADSPKKPPTTPGDNMPPNAQPQNKDMNNEVAKAEIAKAQQAATDAAAQTVALKKQLDDAETKRVELEKQVATERNVRLEKEFIAKAAAKFPQLPVKAEELGPVLKALNDVAPEHAAKLEKFLEQTNEKLKTVDSLLKELGRSAPDDNEKSAMAELHKAATELRKADPKLSQPQAITKAMELNPGLYERYNAEQQGRA